MQAERVRCAEWCERGAIIFDESAAKLRADGTYTTRSLWPPFKKFSFVHHNWERAALEKENAARAIRTIKQSILEGWEPK